MTRQTHIIGNWKMNQTVNDIKTFCETLQNAVSNTNCVVGISPQAIHLSLLKELAPKGVIIGTQNCSNKESGALTGELSPVAIKELGIDFTLIGHSERRAIFQENDKLLNEKCALALKNNLKVIFCVGETLEEREKHSTNNVIKEQLVNGLKNIDLKYQEQLIIAYEPVWAIGTGKTATPQQAEDVHEYARTCLSEMGYNKDEIIIVYGGSVKPSNVNDLLSKNNIDGALVGGASLKASDFSQLFI